MSEAHDDYVGDFSDYHDGSLPDERRRAVEAHLAECAACKDELAQFRETMDALSGLKKVHAPRDMGDQVAATINQRSAGRFFGRRGLGDRIPFGLVAAVGLVLVLAIYLLMRWSDSGAIDEPLRREPKAPTVAPELKDRIPTP